MHRSWVPHINQFWQLLTKTWSFPDDSAVKNLPANAGHTGWIPRSGRSPGERNGNPFQYSCLGNPEAPGGLQSMGITKESGHLVTKKKQQPRYRILCCWSKLIYSVVLVSGVQQSDSVIGSYLIFFSIMVYYRILTTTEYCSLCCAVGPCCLSILYIVVCIC